MDWRRVLAYITGTVDEELLLRNEYLAAENRILLEQLQGRLRLTDLQRKTLAEIGYRLGRKALAEVANIVKPETILSWYRKLVAQKFDGSKARGVGRPQISPEVETLIVRMAKENSGWGYDRIAGALSNLGHSVSDQTIGNVLRRHDIPPAPARKKTTWAEFIRSHRVVLAATDFLSVAKLILFGEASLRRALDNYMPHYHEERNHQGKSNVLLFPQKVKSRSDAAIECHQRLGGLLRYYHRKAA